MDNSKPLDPVVRSPRVRGVDGRRLIGVKDFYELTQLKIKNPLPPPF